MPAKWEGVTSAGVSRRAMDLAPHVPAMVATGLLLGVWAVLGAAMGWLAHARMTRIEAATGRRAVPALERELLWYALASLVWLSAGIVAVICVAKREWARVGRNATVLFVLQVALAVLAAGACAAVNAEAEHESVLPSAKELFALAVAACVLASINFLVTCGFAWVWASARRDRLVRGARPGAGPGAWRFAAYVGSLFFWPVGFVCVGVLSSPADATVGARAFRLSLVNVAVTALAVCVALPLLLRAWMR